MNDKDRIRLAEAMGWKRSACELYGRGSFKGWDSPDGKSFSVTLDFDPFTDANDDYSVLEWLRANPERHSDAIMILGSRMRRYHIGDYARAALKVLDDD